MTGAILNCPTSANHLDWVWIRRCDADSAPGCRVEFLSLRDTLDLWGIYATEGKMGDPHPKNLLAQVS